MANSLLTHDLSVPLEGATTAKVDIDCGTGHLTIGRLGGGEPLLAGGRLEYLEKQEPPACTLSVSNGQAALMLRRQGSRHTGFRWPWEACGGGAYEWQIQLNPGVPCDITAHSDGGNVRLDLAGMAITRLAADAGGGNMDVVLPDNAQGLNVTVRAGGGNVSVEVGSGTTGSNVIDASSGAGNVTVRVPGGIAARVHATSRLGKVLVDPQFGKTDTDTYQSPGYDGAASKVEIAARSGAGTVRIIAG
jgi:hypothetical protein